MIDLYSRILDLNLHSVGNNLYKIINLLELASSEATPQSVEQLAIGKWTACLFEVGKLYRLKSYN